jgi:membrane protein DedA with SNARE-associated domain
VTPPEWLVEHSYAVVLVAAAVDATALPFPGRLVLVGAGALAASGGLDVLGVTAAGVAGAVAGDHLWYFGGRLAGGRLAALVRGLARRVGRRPVDPLAHLERWGSATIVIGRFVAVVRMLVWPLASAHGVGYGRFLAWDLAAATLWVGGLVAGGYVFGKPALAVAAALRGPVLVTAAVAAVALAVAWALRRRRKTAGPGGRAPGSAPAGQASPSLRSWRAMISRWISDVPS